MACFSVFVTVREGSFRSEKVDAASGRTSMDRRSSSDAVRVYARLKVRRSVERLVHESVRRG